MNQGFSYNLINQISLYAGFNPELSLSTGKNSITNTANSLFVDYHCFPIYREGISMRGESFPPLRELLPTLAKLLPPLRESFPPLGELLPPLRKLLLPLGKSFAPLRKLLPPLRELLPLLRESFPTLRELFPPLGEPLPPLAESFLLKQNGWLMHRESFLPIHIRSLLQDKAFIFVYTLFRRRNRIFPISCELFRQRGETSAFGKDQVILI